MRTCRFRNSLVLLLLYLPLQPQCLSERSTPLGLGSLEGRVVNEMGNGVSGATVFAMADGPHVSRLPSVTTEEDGHFIVGELTPGTYAMFALMEEAYYPDTVFALFNTDPNESPRVRVDASMRTRGITVQVRKGGRLKLTIVDSRNGQPLADSRIRLSRSDDPHLFLETGPSERARFERVIPSKPFTVEVTASGYQAWTSDGHGGPIQVQPGATKEITIKLRKTDTAR